MHHTVVHGPSSALLKIELAPGETLLGEAGAMVARAAHLDMHARLNAGRRAGLFGMLRALMFALLRRLVGGETFFVSEFSSPRGGWVWLAPALSGTIRHVRLDGRPLLLTAGSYLASAGEVDLRIRFAGLRGLLAREGAFFLEASGHGDLWITSYGGLDEIECRGRYVVDNGHLVAFDASLDFSIRSAGGGFLGFVASGEGLVCEFHGEGRILIQARNLSSLVSWLSPLLPG